MIWRWYHSFERYASSKYNNCQNTIPIISATSIISRHFDETSYKNRTIVYIYRFNAREKRHDCFVKRHGFFHTAMVIYKLSSKSLNWLHMHKDQSELITFSGNLPNWLWGTLDKTCMWRTGYGSEMTAYLTNVNHLRMDVCLSTWSQRSTYIFFASVEA